MTGENITLPTEAQWEYACRAGSKTALYSGDIKIAGENNAPALDPIAWYGGNSGENYSGGKEEGGVDSSGWPKKQYASSPSGTHEVKGKESNAWGLFDMLGNVWEWCSDRWDQDYYEKSPLTDPAGPANGKARCFRGGCWFGAARFSRSAVRNGGDPAARGNNMGFRPLLVPQSNSQPVSE